MLTGGAFPIESVYVQQRIVVRQVSCERRHAHPETRVPSVDWEQLSQQHGDPPVIMRGVEERERYTVIPLLAIPQPPIDRVMLAPRVPGE